MGKRYDLAIPAGIAPDDLVPTLNERLRLIDSVLAKAPTTTAAATTTKANGTHTTRITVVPASRETVGSLFWEDDREALYQVAQDGAARVWVYRLGTMRGTYSARPTDLGTYDEGFLYYATDRTVIYRWDGSVWKYDSGTMRDVIANLPTLASHDTGFLFFATDYVHLYRWDGAAWDYADSDRSGKFVEWDADPGTGWHLCDGSTVTRSKADGTTASVVLPDRTTGVYAKGAAAYSATIQPAVAPGITGNTDDESAHTHNVTVAAGVTGDESAHTHSVTTGGGTTGAPNSNQLVASGSAIAVASSTHTHTESTQTVTSGSGSAHHHTTPAQTVASAAGAAHHHGLSAAAVDDTAEPKHIDVLVYYRL